MRCELPRCVDLYQSPAIKLNWQTGTCGSPALQPVLVGVQAEHVRPCTHTRTHTAVLVEAGQKW